MERGTRRIDDEAMATDFVPGARSYAYLAMKYGLTLAAVGQIVSTWRPPALPWTVEEAQKTVQGRAQLRLTGLVETAVEVLAAGVSGGATPLAMAAAKQILDRALGPPRRGGGAEPWQAGLAGPISAACANGQGVVRLSELSVDTLQMVARDMLAREKDRMALSQESQRAGEKPLGPTRPRWYTCRALPEPVPALPPPPGKTAEADGRGED